MNHLQTVAPSMGHTRVVAQLRALIGGLPPAERPATSGFVLLRLAKDVDGLGLKGALVIADPGRVPGVDDWMVVQVPGGYRFQHRRDGGQCYATVIRVV